MKGSSRHGFLPTFTQRYHSISLHWSNIEIFETLRLLETSTMIYILKMEMMKIWTWNLIWEWPKERSTDKKGTLSKWHKSNLGLETWSESGPRKDPQTKRHTLIMSMMKFWTWNLIWEWPKERHTDKGRDGREEVAEHLYVGDQGLHLRELFWTLWWCCWTPRLSLWNGDDCNLEPWVILMMPLYKVGWR